MVFGSIGTAVRQELVAAAIKARIDRDNRVFMECSAWLWMFHNTGRPGIGRKH